jgi:hypothetical protein
MHASTSAGSFGQASERLSPGSYERPVPARSITTWRTSLSDSGRVSRSADSTRTGTVAGAASAGGGASAAAAGASASIAFSARMVGFAPGTQRPAEVSRPSASASA